MPDMAGGDPGRPLLHIGRRAALRGGGAAVGLISTLALPEAATAASGLDLSSLSTYTIGFTQAATGTATNAAYGFRLEPDQQQPSGIGTPPPSGDVRLVHLDVLFAGGGGTKAVTGAAVDLAVYPSTAKRSGAAVTDQAVGGVISAWSDATVIATSGTDTWMRFPFTGGDVLIDVGTTWYVGAIGASGAFQSAMSVRTAAQSSGAWSSAIDSAGTAYTFRVVVTGTFAY